MTATCPHCGGTGVIAGPVEAKADEFRRICRENGWPMLADEVTPEVAARLTRLELKTLANRRSDFRPPRYVKSGRSVRYPIIPLAEFSIFGG